MSYDKWKIRSPDDELDRARAAFDEGRGDEMVRAAKAVSALINIDNITPDNITSVETKLLELLRLLKTKRAEMLNAEPTSDDGA